MSEERENELPFMVLSEERVTSSFGYNTYVRTVMAMEIPDVGCVIQVSTRYENNVAEALTFVPDVKIVTRGGKKMIVSRFLDY